MPIDERKSGSRFVLIVMVTLIVMSAGGGMYLWLRNPDAYRVNTHVGILPGNLGRNVLRIEERSGGQFQCLGRVLPDLTRLEEYLSSLEVDHLGDGLFLLCVQKAYEKGADPYYVVKPFAERNDLDLFVKLPTGETSPWAYWAVRSSKSRYFIDPDAPLTDPAQEETLRLLREAQRQYLESHSGHE